MAWAYTLCRLVKMSRWMEKCLTMQPEVQGSLRNKEFTVLKHVAVIHANTIFWLWKDESRSLPKPQGKSWSFRYLRLLGICRAFWSAVVMWWYWYLNNGNLPVYASQPKVGKNRGMVFNLYSLVMLIQDKMKENIIIVAYFSRTSLSDI